MMDKLTEAIKMPSNFTPDESQRKALLTWYNEDDPRYLDPRHPLIKLAGEAGELLDLFGKHEYKPGFDWWNCKHCGAIENCGKLVNGCKGYTPLVLDELGDFWYYLRILTWQQGVSVEGWVKELGEVFRQTELSTLNCLSLMNYHSAKALHTYCYFNTVSINLNIWASFVNFMDLLKILDCTLDQLTELNYQKLNSKPGAHGWKVESEVMPSASG